MLTNFEIGRRIVEHEQKGQKRAESGKQILKGLSKELTAEFGKGFSETNLKLIRQFYLLDQGRISQTVFDQLFSYPKIQTLSASRSLPLGEYNFRIIAGTTGAQNSVPFIQKEPGTRLP